MDFTWAIGLIALAILFVGIIVFIKMAKKSRQVLGFLAVVAGGIGLLAVSGVVPQLGDLNKPIAFATAPGEVEERPAFVEGELCAVEDTTVTLSATNKYTTAATGGTHRYRINGAPALTVSDAGTLTASPGDALEILWMNGSETDSEYFSVVSNEVVPCVGTKTFYQDMSSNGSITIEVFNEEGNLIDTAGENETVAAGDVVTLTMKLKGTYQKDHPYGGIIVAEYPNPTYDDVIIDLGGSKVSTPTWYTVANGSQTTRAYEVPAIISTEIIQGSLTIDVDDSWNPDDTVPADAMNLTYYPYDHWINEDTGGSFDGPSVEDEDNTQTKKYSLQYAVALD